MRSHGVEAPPPRFHGALDNGAEFVMSPGIFHCPSVVGTPSLPLKQMLHDTGEVGILHHMPRLEQIEISYLHKTFLFTSTLQHR